MINLQKFCSKDTARYKLNAPFSRGALSYATDGHICVRVPRLQDVKEYPDAPDAEKLFKLADGRKGYVWVKVPEKIPDVERETWVCDECEGEGSYHGAKCDDCNGTGKYEHDKFTPVPFMVHGIEIGLSNIYLKLIKDELPNPMIGLIKTAINGGDPVKIRFDGGEGLLTGCRL